MYAIGFERSDRQYPVKLDDLICAGSKPNSACIAVETKLNQTTKLMKKANQVRSKMRSRSLKVKIPDINNQYFKCYEILVLTLL